MGRALSILLLAVGFLMIPLFIHAEVYKWTDDKGTIHFTDDNSNMPEKYLPHAETQRSPKETPTSGIEQESAPARVPESSESSEQETPRLFSGVITGVDSSGMSITVAGDGNEMVFTVSQDTRITTDYGKNVSFSELKNAMPVTVEYIDKDGNLQARSVKVNLLPAGVTNAVEDNQAPGPGQLENPGQVQQGVWSDQQQHQTMPDGTPSKPPQFKLKKPSTK
jgi:hypothetical protein